MRLTLQILLVSCSALSAAPIPKSKDPSKALEEKLLGEWKGEPCMGDLKFKADGSYTRIHFTPAGISLTGTWRVRWDALPPTLVLTCTESDDEERIGKDWEVKLVELNDKKLRYQFTNEKPQSYTRVKK